MDGVRRFFGGGDFFSWSVPLFTLFAVRVRIHLLFIVFVAVQLAWSARRDSIGVMYMALGMGAIFLIVLLHEFGHCFACRWVKGEADRIVLWPLGGLAFCLPPHTWRANLVTTVGGPLVNVVLWPVLAGCVVAAGGGLDSVFFNPFDPASVLAQPAFVEWWRVMVWWVYYMNVVMLGFNLLMPMFPLDGARIVQELLWAKMGYRRSMEIAVNVGLVTAVVVGMAGLVTGQSLLFGIAVFAGITCWFERRKLEFLDEVAMESESWRGGATEEPEDRGPTRAERKRLEQEAAEQAEEDRILAKIAASGMGSLTSKEKRALERATEKRRQMSGPRR